MPNEDNKSNPIIRDMQEGDIEAIAQISKEGFDDYYPFDYEESAKILWENTQKERANVYVAETDGETVGYITLRRWHSGGWIDVISVSKKSRRCGIAQMLVEHLTKEAQSKGMRYLSCMIFAELSSVKSFWLSCGFKIVGTMEKCVSKTQDALLFYKYIEGI